MAEKRGRGRPKGSKNKKGTKKDINAVKDISSTVVDEPVEKKQDPEQ